MTLDEYDNELIVVVWAEFGTGEEVSAEEYALRVNEVTIEERSMWVGGETFAGYAFEPQQPTVTLFRDMDFEQLQDFTTVDKTYATNASGSASGMDVSGSSDVDVLCNLDLATGDRFFGLSLDGSCEASITLTNPDPAFHRYQASSGAWVEVDIEFHVWGEPASFNMHGTVSGEEYDIELYGDDTLFLCDSYDEPCGTISTGGELPPARTIWTSRSTAAVSCRTARPRRARKPATA